MRLELYQQETERLASDLQAMLDAVSQRLHQQQMLSALEQAGVLHALQVLTENAIGKAKVWIKQRQLPVPVSAYVHLLNFIAKKSLTMKHCEIGQQPSA